MIEPLKPRQASKYLASFCIGSSRPFSVAISVAPPATLRTLSPRYRSTSSSQIGVVQVRVMFVCSVDKVLRSSRENMSRLSLAAGSGGFK